MLLCCPPVDDLYASGVLVRHWRIQPGPINEILIYMIDVPILSENEGSNH
jgi:hypothetical protein